LGRMPNIPLPAAGKVAKATERVVGSSVFES